MFPVITANKITCQCVYICALGVSYVPHTPLVLHSPSTLSPTPTLFYLVPLLPFHSQAFPFLLFPHWLFDNVCTNPSPAGVRRSRCHRSLCTCSSVAGARRGCHRRRSLCRCSSAAGARRFCYRGSLCRCSSAAGVRRFCYHHSLCTGSSSALACRCCCRRSLASAPQVLVLFLIRKVER